MKLDKATITYLHNVVKTAQLIGLESIIIEKDIIRAMDDSRTIVLLQKENIPNLPFESLGLGRINIFLSRLDVVKTQDDFTIQVGSDKESEFVRSLTMKGKGIKIDYRCAKPDTIRAPRQINDVMKHRVKLTGEAVSLLQKAYPTMGAETISIISNDDVSFEMVDINNDIYKHIFANSVEALTDDDDVRFAHQYPAKFLLPLFKHNPEGHINISQKGILNITVNGLNIYVMPHVGIS